MLSNSKLSDLAPSGLDPNTARLVFLGNRDSGIPFRSQKPHFFVELFNFAAICLLIRRQKCRGKPFWLAGRSANESIGKTGAFKSINF
jgi:hypothetical protein